MTIETGQLVESPISGSACVRAEGFEVERIVSAYREAVGLDVADYFAGRELIWLFTCPDTGYRFFAPDSLAGGRELYSALQDFPWYYKLRREHLQAKQWVKAGSTLLEVGCGRGTFLNAVKDRVTGEGIESNVDAVAFARSEYGLDVSARAIEEMVAAGKTYDYVAAFEVLEHVCTPRDFVQSMAKLLKPNGRLLLSVPNCNPYSLRFDRYDPLNLPPHHMGYWDVGALKRFAAWCGLRVERVWVEPLGGIARRYVAFQIAHYEALKRPSPNDARRLRFFRWAAGSERRLRLCARLWAGRTILIRLRRTGGGLD